MAGAASLPRPDSALTLCELGYQGLCVRNACISPMNARPLMACVAQGICAATTDRSGGAGGKLCVEVSLLTVAQKVFAAS